MPNHEKIENTSNSDAFLNELVERYQDWKKNGGVSLEELKQKYRP